MCLEKEMGVMAMAEGRGIVKRMGRWSESKDGRVVNDIGRWEREGETMRLSSVWPLLWVGVEVMVRVELVEVRKC